jgi:hypothetical protein
LVTRDRVFSKTYGFSRKGKSPSLPSNVSDELTERGILFVKPPGSNRYRQPLPAASHKRAITDAISGTLLEYQNGWAPLVREIDSASRALATHFAAAGVSTETVVGKGGSEPSGTSLVQVQSVANGTYTANYAVRKEASCRVVGQVVCSHTGSTEDLLRSAGFTWGNFAATIWELLPLSYVADYFLNMGNVLQAYALLRGSVPWTSRSSKTLVTITGVGSNVAFNTFGGTLVWQKGHVGSSVTRLKSFERDVILTFVPSLTIQLPGSGLLRRLSNTSALLFQARSSSRQISRLYNG